MVEGGGGEGIGRQEPCIVQLFFLTGDLKLFKAITRMLKKPFSPIIDFSPSAYCLVFN